jgi:GntR family transcriptional repressor for pyruvate dehydrogenase complex
MAEPAARGEVQGPAIRFADVEVRKLSTALADSITDTILKSGLQPGARLPSEREMREQFGVGRGTLREALRVLEAEGLITVRSGPHGGPVIARPDAIRLARLLILLLIAWGATLGSVYEVRMVLEPLAAARAAESASAEQIDELRASVAKLNEVLDDEAAVIEENQRFHRLLAEASGNPVVVAFSLALLTIFDGYEMGTHYALDTRQDIAAIHARMVDAIAAGDADASRRASLSHVRGTMEFLQEHYPEVLDEPLRPTLITQGQEPLSRRTS